MSNLPALRDTSTTKVAAIVGALLGFLGLVALIRKLNP